MKIEDGLLNRIICGDCLEIMKGLPDSSVDLVVTDPPYGLSFMSKDWDKAVPPIGMWKECLRVLKPGGFAFIMCIPRQDCLSRMVANLQDAGFDTAFTSIYWAFASGFPKSENISIAIDKRECKKHLIEKLGRGPTKEEFEEAWKSFRELVGKYTHPRSVEQGKKIDNSWGKNSLDNTLEGYLTQGDDKRTLAERLEITTPTSPQAKALDGSYGGFQPKPAVEVILVAMKPMSKDTYIDQALKNTKGITWLDECRVPIADGDRHEYGIDGDEGDPTVNCYGKYNRVEYRQHNRGRFPANLVVSDGVLNDGEIRTSVKSTETHKEYGSSFKFGGGVSSPNNQYSDFGSFSRYFDLDRWWEKRIERLPEEVRRVFPFLIVPKASKSERDKGCEKLPKRQEQITTPEGGGGGWVSDSAKNPNLPRANYHPTVKPLQLMSYLVTLGSREGDIILDPFVGTGPTVISCRLLGRKYVGIEIEPDYCEIARHRLSCIPRRLDEYG